MTTTVDPRLRTGASVHGASVHGASVHGASAHLASVHVAETTPYPWPWNGELDPTATAVLVVGPERRGPELAGPEASAVEALATSTVVAATRAAGGAVIRVVTAPPRRPPGSAGRVGVPVPDAQADAADDGAADAVAHAAGLDGFFGSGLESLLRSRRIERLLLVGSGLETAIHSTMRTANDMGFECLLVVDACVPHDTELVAASVSMIEMSGGIFGAVGNSAALIEALHRAEGRTS
jgi:nicotinamidase-related amidase